MPNSIDDRNDIETYLTGKYVMQTKEAREIRDSLNKKWLAAMAVVLGASVFAIAWSTAKVAIETSVLGETGHLIEQKKLEAIADTKLIHESLNNGTAAAWTYIRLDKKGEISVQEPNYNIKRITQESLHGQQAFNIEFNRAFQNDHYAFAGMSIAGPPVNFGKNLPGSIQVLFPPRPENELSIVFFGELATENANK